MTNDIYNQWMQNPLTSPVNPYHTNPYYNPQPIITQQYQYEQKPNHGDNFYPVECGNNTNHVVFILDESGSMGSVYDVTITSFNEYVENQKNDSMKTGIKTFISLYKFDGYNIKEVYNKKDVLETPKLDKNNYRPGGGTNLLDSIGTVMVNTNKDLGDMPVNLRPSLIFVILTDGEENTSKYYDNDDIKKMVSKAGDAKWSFMFLGANINAFETGSKYGFTTHNSIQLSGSAASVAAGINSASEMTTRLRSAYSTNAYSDVKTMYADVGFTDEEREKSAE